MSEEREVARAFGENLRRCRRRAKLSQEALGFVSGLHRTEVGLLERGARTPRIDTLIKLSSSLEIEPGELLTGISWNEGRREVIEGAFEITEDGADEI